MSVTIKNKGVIKDGGEKKTNNTSSPSARLKNENAIPVAENSLTSVSKDAIRWKYQAIKNIKLEMPDIDIKGFVLYRLL